MDLTPVVVGAEDGKGYSMDLCVDCWATNGGIRSIGAFREEQSLRRGGNVEEQPFEDGSRH